MRKDRSKVEVFVSSWGKTDSAKWKDRTIKSLTHAQLRIRHLCKAYLAGEITPTEFKQELPRILNVRDREKRSMNS
jgi:ribosome-binding factor A